MVFPKRSRTVLLVEGGDVDICVVESRSPSAPVRTDRPPNDRSTCGRQETPCPVVGPVRGAESQSQMASAAGMNGSDRGRRLSGGRVPHYLQHPNGELLKWNRGVSHHGTETQVLVCCQWLRCSCTWNHTTCWLHPNKPIQPITGTPTGRSLRDTEPNRGRR